MSLLKIFSMMSAQSRCPQKIIQSRTHKKFAQQLFFSQLIMLHMIDVHKSKYRCDLCEKSFKDRTHLTEHIVSMHSEPTPCLICNLVYPDKQSAISHQKMCTRRCPFDHCAHIYEAPKGPYAQKIQDILKDILVFLHP